MDSSSDLLPLTEHEERVQDFDSLNDALYQQLHARKSSSERSRYDGQSPGQSRRLSISNPESGAVALPALCGWAPTFEPRSDRADDKSTEFHRKATLFIGLTLVIVVSLAIEIVIGAEQLLKHGAVASTSELCSKIGLNMLTKGGSAVDAAVGAMVCLGVISPEVSGLGSGGIMLIRDHVKGTMISLDFTKPLQSQTAEPEDQGVPPSPEALPKQLYGMWAAHRTYGRLAWHQVLQPSIDLVTNGFSVSNSYVKDLLNQSQYWAQFFNLDQQHLEELAVADKGTMVLKQKQLAQILKRIAIDGIDTFQHSNSAPPFGHGDGKQQEEQLAVNMSAISGKLLETSLRGFNVVSPSRRLSAALDRIFKYFEGDQRKLTRLSFSEFLVYYSKVLINICEGGGNFTGLTLAPSPDVSTQMISDICLKNAEVGRKVSYVSVVDSHELLVSFSSAHFLNLKDFTGAESGYVMNKRLGRSKEHLIDGESNDELYVHAVVYRPKKPCDIRMVVGTDRGVESINPLAITILQAVLNNETLQDAVAYPKLFYKEGSIYVEHFSEAANFVEAVETELEVPVKILNTPPPVAVVEAVGRKHFDFDFGSNSVDPSTSVSF